jgi:uncharacterized membrane protein
MKFVRTITINRSPEEVFASWRQLETLPRYMNHLVSVKVVNDKVSHWIAKAPAGRQVSWEAEITEEHANQFLAWHSRKGADVPNAGTVHFQHAPAGRGTEVTVSLECVVPAGILGRTVARFFGEEPSRQVEDDLRRFKSVLETGEAPSSGGGRPG